MWQRALELLTAYRAVVFDLDGTVLMLKVDWRAAQREMADLASASTGRDFAGMSVWEILRSTKGHTREALEALLRKREVEGAEEAEKKALADLFILLKGFKRGIVSMNSKASCEIALQRAGIRQYVDVLVAREDTERLKPDPEPLLRCIQLLGHAPGDSVFIGDRERDRITAVRAGTDFYSPEDLVG
ncbi:MAG: HAD family hydrolase [Thermoplasmata archaeon]